MIPTSLVWVYDPVDTQPKVSQTSAIETFGQDLAQVEDLAPAHQPEPVTIQMDSKILSDW